MAKFQRIAGSTSQSVNVMVRNSSSTTGGGLTAVAPAGGSLLSGTKLYYSFTGSNCGSTSVSLSVLSAFNSAYSSGGIVTIDDTNMAGEVRIDVPNASIAASKGNLVTYYLYGGANMAPAIFEIELTSVDNQLSSFGMTLAAINVAAAAGTLSLGGLVVNTGSVTLNPFQVSGGQYTLTGFNTSAGTVTFGVAQISSGNATLSALNVTTSTYTTFQVSGGGQTYANYQINSGAYTLGAFNSSSGTLTLGVAQISSGNATLSALNVSGGTLTHGVMQINSGNVTLTALNNSTGTSTFAILQSTTGVLNSVASVQTVNGNVSGNVANLTAGTITALNVAAAQGTLTLGVFNTNGGTLTHQLMQINSGNVSLSAINTNGGSATFNIFQSTTGVVNSVASVQTVNGNISGNLVGNVQGSLVGNVSGTVAATTFVASGTVGLASVVTTCTTVQTVAGNVNGTVANTTAISGTVALFSGQNIKADVEQWKGTNVLVPDLAGTPKLSTYDSLIINNGSGTAAAGGASTITLQTAIGGNSYPDGCIIKIISGTGAGQVRGIAGYVDATKVVTTDRAWNTNPDNTSVYAIYAQESPSLNAALNVALDWNNIVNPTTTVNLSATTIASVTSGGGGFNGTVTALNVSAANGTLSLGSFVVNGGNISLTAFNNSTGVSTFATFQTTSGVVNSVASVQTVNGSVVGAVGSVTGNVGGTVANVTNLVGGTITALNVNSANGTLSLGSLQVNGGNLTLTALNNSTGTSTFAILQSTTGVLHSVAQVQTAGNTVLVSGTGLNFDGNGYVDVNIVDIAGVASAGSSGHVGIDWGQISNPTSIVNLSNTTLASVTSGGSFSGTITAINVAAANGTLSLGSFVVNSGNVTLASLNSTLSTYGTLQVNGGNVTLSQISSSMATIGTLSTSTGGVTLAGINVTGLILTPGIDITSSLTVANAAINAGNITLASLNSTSGNITLNPLQISSGNASLSYLNASTGSVGINWNNIVNPNSNVNLSNTTIASVTSGGGSFSGTITAINVSAANGTLSLGSFNVASGSVTLGYMNSGAGTIKSDVRNWNGTLTQLYGTYPFVSTGASSGGNANLVSVLGQPVSVDSNGYLEVDAIKLPVPVQSGYGGSIIMGSASGVPLVYIDGVQLSAIANNPFAATFVATGLVSTSYSQFLWTLKRVQSDPDNRALLQIQVSYPTQGDDGLTIINGNSPSAFGITASEASITVVETTPSTELGINVSAKAMALQPTSNGQSDTNSYYWDLSYYKAGVKQTNIGWGKLQVYSSVYHSTTENS